MMSKGEDKLAKIFKDSKVPYKKEYCFDDCNSTKHQPMRFDFALFDDGGHLVALCEFDGEQHFHQVKKFQRSRADFQKTQGHDRQKNAYALAHGIPLYRVPYWDIDKITTLRDILTNDHLVKTRYHNDNLILSD